MATYSIVRFYRDDRPSEVIRRGLSIEQAKAHCAAPSTRGEDFFDGYRREEGTLHEYEVVITIRVQGASMADVPGLVLEAWGDHDVFPAYVTPLDGDERPDEIWIDKNTGLAWVPPQEGSQTG